MSLAFLIYLLKNLISMQNSHQAKKYDVIVIGGGVHGLSTAYCLAKKGIKIALIEKFSFGHKNGGSHSETRIMRSTYEEKLYKELATLAMK